MPRRHCWQVQRRPGPPSRLRLAVSHGRAPYTVYAADFDGDGRPDFAAVNGDAAPSRCICARRPAASRRSPARRSRAPRATVRSATSTATAARISPRRLRLGEGIAVLLRNAGGGFTRETAPGSAAAERRRRGGLQRRRPHRPRRRRMDRRQRLDPAAQPRPTTASRSPQLRRRGPTRARSRSPTSTATADPRPRGRQQRQRATYDPARQRRRHLRAEGAAVTGGRRPAGIAAADFDGNGRPDLAVTNYGDSTVSVLLRDAANNGFTPDAGSPVAVGASPLRIATGRLRPQRHAGHRRRRQRRRGGDPPARAGGLRARRADPGRRARERRRRRRLQRRHLPGRRGLVATTNSVRRLLTVAAGAAARADADADADATPLRRRTRRDRQPQRSERQGQGQAQGHQAFIDLAQA